jgi:hypothetical protein
MSYTCVVEEGVSEGIQNPMAISSENVALLTIDVVEPTIVNKTQGSLHPMDESLECKFNTIGLDHISKGTSSLLISNVLFDAVSW